MVNSSDYGEKFRLWGKVPTMVKSSDYGEEFRDYGEKFQLW
jgi:hypothetical protein